MFAARLAAQLPARRALVQYPTRARAFASKKSKQPQQEPSDSQPAASSQSSSKPSNEPLNADPSASEPAALGEASDPKPSELPSLSTLDFTAADETSRSERTGARSAKDSPSSIERKTRLMSNLMVGVAALGLGMYAVSLGGEWTEEELKEKKMASLRRRHPVKLLNVVRIYADIRNCAFNKVGANSGESRQRVRCTFSPNWLSTRLTLPSFSCSRNQYGPNFCRLHSQRPTRSPIPSFSPWMTCL